METIFNCIKYPDFLNALLMELILFKNWFIFIFIRKVERYGYSFCWFNPQMSITARVEPGQNQEPGTQFRSTKRVARTQALEPYFYLPVSKLAERVRSGTETLNPSSPIWDADILYDDLITVLNLCIRTNSLKNNDYLYVASNNDVIFHSNSRKKEITF